MAIRSNYTGGGLAPGSALGSQPPAATPPQVTDAPGFGPRRNRPRNRLAPGAGLPGPRNIVTQPPAKPPAPPTYSATTVTNPPPSVPTDPRDAIYYGNVAAHTAGVNTQIAGYGKQQTDADVALANTLAGYAHQQPLDVLAAQIAANRTGGLSSTSLGQHIGNIGYGYTQRRAGAQAARDAAWNALASQIAAARTGDIEYGAGQLEDAADRAVTAAANNPVIGGVAPPVTSPAAGARTAPTRVRPKGAPANAKWAGPNKPGSNWRGIGGGWWVPPAGGKK